MSPTSISSNRIHSFNQITLAIDKIVRESFEKEINLLLLPEEIERNAIVAYQWDTAMDERVCPLCESLHGQVFPADSPEFGRLAPPLHPNCFISARTPIYTVSGWKKIKQIKVGDLVLTHKGRFRRVTRLFRDYAYKGKVIKIVFNGSFLNVSITPEHPFLTTKGWKKASQLKKSDLITVLATSCKRCGNKIPFFRVYCSHTCLSKDITDKQWSNPKHRKKMSRIARKNILEEYASGRRDPHDITRKAHERVREIVKSNVPWGWQDPIKLQNTLNKIDRKAQGIESSKRMRKFNPMFDPIIREKARLSIQKFLKDHPEKHPNYILARRGHMTSLEKKIGKILKELGIYAEFNYSLNGYFIDWAIIDQRVAIEVDGNYWHQDKSKDMQRQQNIEKLGWSVIRFSEDEINGDIQGCREKLIRLLSNHYDQFEFTSIKIKKIIRHHHKRYGYKLFNFAVEEDESYIAKGLISHNCRCLLSYITGQERGIQDRLEEYRPIDPDLLEKWSSKIYTPEEIREMTIKRKKVEFTVEQLEDMVQEKENYYLRATNQLPKTSDSSFDELLMESGEFCQTKEEAVILIKQLELPGDPVRMPEGSFGKWGIKYRGVNAKRYYDEGLMSELPYLGVFEGKYLGGNVLGDGDIIKIVKIIGVFEKSKPGIYTRLII